MRFLGHVGRFVFVAALCAFFWRDFIAAVADASENQVPKSISDPNDGGVGIRQSGPLPAQFSNLTIQCPNVDIYLRAGCDGGLCVVDAGPGDLFVSFNASNDSYPFPLDRSSNQNQIFWQNVDGGAAACYLFRVLP